MDLSRGDIQHLAFERQEPNGLVKSKLERSKTTGKSGISHGIQSEPQGSGLWQ